MFIMKRIGLVILAALFAWLDGALRLGFVLHDEPLLKKIKARLDPIVEGVNRGTKSFIYWKKALDPKGSTVEHIRISGFI
ncbi:MAG: hypothetical protein WCJ35_14860 [Planctomycetota bacterium]